MTPGRGIEQVVALEPQVPPMDGLNIATWGLEHLEQLPAGDDSGNQQFPGVARQSIPNHIVLVRQNCMGLYQL